MSGKAALPQILRRCGWLSMTILFRLAQQDIFLRSLQHAISLDLQKVWLFEGAFDYGLGI